MLLAKGEHIERIDCAEWPDSVLAHGDRDPREQWPPARPLSPARVSTSSREDAASTVLLLELFPDGAVAPLVPSPSA